MSNINFTLSWSKLKVWIIEKTSNFFSNNSKKRIILDEVSGQIKNNTLVAIMGNSGSGKTTFLAAIAGKIKTKSGTVMVNKEIADEDYLNMVAGYVYQDEIFPEYLTLGEYMNFLGALKLNHKTYDECEWVVRNIIDDLNLTSTEDTLIQKLSGGERKRLALANELLLDPFILFCDEPTTGLDSSSSVLIIKKLQHMAVLGKLVIATIHQPSSQLFEYFNHVILLSDGKLVFQGNKEQLGDAFTTENLICPQLYNPIDFYIKCITPMGENKFETLHLIKILYDKFAFVELTSFGSTCLKKIVIKRRMVIEIYWLIWRSIKETRRNLRSHLFHFGILMVTALILVSIYGSVWPYDEKGVQNISGLLYFIVSEMIFTHMYSVIYTFPSELPITLREKQLYSPHSYFLSKIISFVPRNTMQPFLFLFVIYYFVIFFHGIGLFWDFFLVLSAACITGSTLGLCLSSIFNTLEYIELFIVPFDLITMVMSGIWIKISTLRIYLAWMKYLSPFFYTYESLSILYWKRITNIDCVVNSTDVCFYNGTCVLQNFGFHQEESQVLWNIFYLSILSTVFSIIGYFGILKNNLLYQLY